VAGDDDDDGNSATATTGVRKSSAAVKRDNPEAWPTLEKEVRAATCRVDLDTLWQKWVDQIATWPVSWREQADELFMVRAGEVGHRDAAE
jgi:hypothetical protein